MWADMQVLTGEQIGRLVVGCLLQRVTSNHRRVVKEAIADRFDCAAKCFVGRVRTPESDTELDRVLRDARPWVRYSN